MARLGRKKLAQLFLWLLVFMPIKPFYSERPYVAAQPPLTKGDLASSHPQPGVYHGLSCGEDHINATLARADVTRWLNPTVILTSLAEIVVLVMIAMMVVYVLVMATFWCCHLGVHWTVSGRCIRPKVNNKTQRTVIQVLISGHSQTEVFTVHLNSSGRTLYQAIQERSGILAPLIHGVKIIRHSISLQEQGIHHLSTIFVLPVMGEGGGKTRLDQEPTLPELTALQGRTRWINIAVEIGVQWEMVGTALLDDRNGIIIPAIARQRLNDAERINTEILRRWVQGKGIPDRTWQGLLGVLRVHCRALAETVEEALTTEEVEPMDLPDQPPSPGATQCCFCLRNLFQRQPHPPYTDLPCPPHNEVSHPSHRTNEIVTPSHTELTHYPVPERSPTSTTKQPKHSHTPTEDPAPTATAQQELSILSSAQWLQQPSPPPTDQTQSSPPSPPHCPLLQPNTPVWYFNQYLVKFYSHLKDPVATWPPLPSEKFINLAIINRKEVSTKELHEFMLTTLNKGVDTILKSKTPVKIEQLMDTLPGKKQHCILVEGAPGVGKTTLSWEICKRWAKENLFKQYSLILLLRLRDETLHKAETVQDLILYPYEEQLEAITQYLKYTDGTHTLILLEGLDELPQYLLTHPSIFTRLLAGELLPDATILVTSRPSATVQLWKKWKERITRHIEILGFTEDNITAYVSSILSPQELPKFDTYLCTAPSIRQLMYIPLHSGIVVELYRVCSDLDKPLPTNKTALYSVLVQTILARYLVKHPKYKDDEIDVEKFTDLPDDVYSAFIKLIELAYNSVTLQQLVFKEMNRPIQHLGFMNAVAELFSFKHKTIYSFSFLHLSIQEYLGATFVSLMDRSTQERLLENMFTSQHLKNMALFLAGITKFKGMNRELVNRAVQSECNEEADGTLTLSKYCLELAFETEVNVLHGHHRYAYKLSQYSPLFDFTALGYCIARSKDTWEIKLGDVSDYMRTTSGVELLSHALHNHSDSRYTIDIIECHHNDTEIAQCLLAGLPWRTLPMVETLWLDSETLQPLPRCLPELISKMNQLRVLKLWKATEVTLADTLQAHTMPPTYTLRVLDLRFSQFSRPAMQALCAILEHSESLAELVLDHCGLTDDLACLLATALQHRLCKLTYVYLAGNRIGETGRATLNKCTTTNNEMKLHF